MKHKYLSSLIWILKLQWRTSRLLIIWNTIYSLLIGVRPLFTAYVLAKLLAGVSQAALQGASPNQVYFWLAITLADELVFMTIANLNRLASTRYEQKIDLVLNEQFFLKMYELSQEQFDNQEFNTKLDRARDSLNQVWRILNEVSWTTSAMIGFVGSMLAILLVSPVVGVIILLTVIPIAILQIRQNKQREEVYKKIEPIDRVAFRSRWMLIDPNYMPEIRLMNAFKNMISSWKVNTKKYQSALYENDKKIAKFDAAVDSVQPIISFGANIYFFKLLLANTIGLDRFMFLRGMLSQASSGAIQTANSIQRLHQLTINLHNFSEVYETLPAIPDGNTTVKSPLTVEFRHVSFAYPGSTTKVLDDVSFLIVPGSKLAVVGENGAGKSTLIKLLLRQYLPTSGSIHVNGVDIREVKLKSYYAAISNLSQEFLMVQHMSVRENLVMGLDREPTTQAIYKTTDLVNATDFIQKLPHGLDSRLDPSFDDGTNLSGGQKQRLGVARALLRNGDIMILDEPTSAIDAKAEYAIFNNIYKSHADKTTLIVSHRFSTVRKADSIIVMENGRITEYGSHDELLKHDGLYKEMFEVQAEGYK
ncbi:ABC transporter ATP-binding protein [Candidatus Saccharibacteria bacterium]|nr:ABC transporter ATP-binding protein [Candidatus Saccharibacteria bacterium]MCB9821134.1 ABC transporter ATP-binding protein [Candidatus Nomurabacteria bacterium]